MAQGQHLPNNPCEPLSVIHHNLRDSNSTVYTNQASTDQMSIKNAERINSGSTGHQKHSKKGFDASTITSRINLKAVSRTSLTRRLSTNSSPSETLCNDQMGATLGSDTSTNSSITSGFSLNMFQTKKPFVAKVFPKQEQQRTEDLRYVQPDPLKLWHDPNSYNQRSLCLQGKPNDDAPIDTSSNCNINLMSQTSQKRPPLSSCPGSSGFARLHYFADPLPSPASAVASLTRDLESDLIKLELRDWAVQGQYVVKPQVMK